MSGGGEQRGDIDEAVNVVGPPVQKDHRRAIGRAGLGVADVQDAGVDLLERPEGRVRPGLNRWQSRGSCLADLCCRRTDYAELRGRNRRGSSIKKATAMPVDPSELVLTSDLLRSMVP